MKGAPKTLQQAIQYFADFDNCQAFLIELRWPDGKVRCPYCGSDHVTYLENARLWKCYGKHEKPKFSLKVGSIMEDSALGIDKWLVAMWLIVNCKNGISSCEIARDLGITQKSAWHMAHRIRKALKRGSFDKLSRNRGRRDLHRRQGSQHAFGKRERRITGTGGKNKVAVMGVLKRDGEVRTMVVPNRRKRAPQAEVRKHVEAGSALCTDAPRHYDPGWLLLGESFAGKKLSEGDPPATFVSTQEGMEQYARDWQKIRAVAYDSAGKQYVSKRVHKRPSWAH